MTYSINISQSTESTSYVDFSYIDTSGGTFSDGNPYFILNSLTDNFNKEVNPRDIRDSILSNWNLPGFKETQNISSIGYIGVDSGNPFNRDIKSKIYFGKRSFSGTYSYSSQYMIMKESLLSNDVDVFFYNTKPDTYSQLKTRISFLSGTNHLLYNNAPYFQSQAVIGTAGQVLSLDIINPSTSGGNISISSLYDRVFLNGISYPTILETSASASNNKVLRYNNGQLYWDDISVSFYNTVGLTGSMLNIFGNPVSINGMPIEFSCSKKTPISFHGVRSGRTFSSVAIVEVLREILYPYLLPLCGLSINHTVAEFGTFPSIKLYYSITKRTNNINTIALANMIPGSLPPIITNGHVTIAGTANGVYISNTNTSFQITVNDGTQSVIASQSLNFVYPYFYGLLTNPFISFSGLSTLNKLVDYQRDQTIPLLGSGYIYFIYDNSYPVLNSIYDSNNNEIYGPSSSFSTFTYSVVTLTSPSWLWTSHQFKVYRSMTSSYFFTLPSSNYQFKY
jgi:hypothetical protein